MTSKTLAALVVACAALCTTAVAQAPETAPAETAAPAATAPNAPAVAAEPAQSATDAEEAAYRAKAQQFLNSLNRRTGRIEIAGGKVVLNVPETHYFVGKEDARRVIVDAWRNPPNAAEGVEGMIFEKDGNPLLDAWGAVVEYRQDGHVDDKDAATINYADLLKEMQQGARDENAQREKEGYESISIVGWAEQPHYDQPAHKLYWAKALQFGDAPMQTLNYDIRVLGRDAVLVISFVSGMDALPSIRTAAPTVLAMPQFTEGWRYEDYKEGVDKKAAYGIAGLIAGGTVVALAKKAGILGLILAFGKKFIVIIGAGLFALFGAIRRGLSGKKDAE